MFFRGYISDWLYELLPYVYLCVGMFMDIQASSMIAAISGVLLISAGAFIWIMRREARKVRVKMNSGSIQV